MVNDDVRYSNIILIDELIGKKYIHRVLTEVDMGKEYSAKSFKSGNSVAIRMPAALGVRPDLEWTVIKQDGEYVIRERAAPKRKFNIAKVAGCATNLKYVEPESRLFEPRPSAVDAFKSST